MIGERLTQFAQATRTAIDLLRVASRLEDIAPTALETLARAARCEWAAYWTVDSQSRALRAIASWSGLGSKGQLFDQQARARIPPTNQGNAARVWRTRKPLWTDNLMLDMGLPRSLRASEAGLRGGIWFAVKTDTAVYGVIELLACTLPLITVQSFVALEQAGVRLGYVIEELLTERPSRSTDIRRPYT